ncbi:MAG: glycosyltransferase family 39 protein [Candidatus Aenigmatarchaeota archaeon]
MIKFIKNKITVFLIIIFFIGLFLRFYNLDKKPFWEDEATYALISNHIFQNFFSDNYLPLLDTKLVVYPHLFFYLNALGQLIFGNTEFGNRFFTALFGSLTIIIIYLIGNTLFNKKIGLITTALLAFSPEHIAFSRENLPFVVPLFFFLSAFYFLKNFSENKDKRTENKKFYLALIFILISLSFNFLISGFFIILIPLISKLDQRNFSFKIKILLILTTTIFAFYIFRVIYYFSGLDFYNFFQENIRRIHLLENLYPTIKLILENYFDFKYLLISLGLTIFLVLSFKKLKFYKNSIIILITLFILTLLLSVFVSSILRGAYSFGYRTHIFFSYILYFTLAISLFIIYKKNKHIFFLITIILLMLFSFHILPLLEKKLLSISEKLDKISVVGTKSIVCSESYYKPLTLHKFINAFLFCFPHHPIYYNDGMDWNQSISFIKSQTKIDETLLFFSSYSPIIKFYLDKEGSLKNKTIAIKDLHCNDIFHFCSKKYQFDVINEVKKYMKIKEKGLNIKIWFIVDSDRYNWQLEDLEKEFINKKCEQTNLNSEIKIFKCA